MSFWNDIEQELNAGHTLFLMYVLHSEGSSPGRQGFKMGVSSSGSLIGSIGGGIMEHKLVELCRSNWNKKAVKPFLKRQIHQDNISDNKSGMICSGEQTIAFYLLEGKNLAVIAEIIEAIFKEKFGVLTANEKALAFQSEITQPDKFQLKIEGPEKWELKEDLGHSPVLHIVGSGHVGLALSDLAGQLGFKVKIYDDREGLNTMEHNRSAESIVVSDYEKIAQYIPSDSKAYVVIMSFGYRTDKIILKNLLDADYKYLGMMGSKKKVALLFEELESEGISSAQLEKVHSPIGLPIFSKTPNEIAISILAELIRVKNS